MTTHEITVEEDRLPGRTIILIAVVSIVIMLFSIWLAWALLAAEEEQILGGSAPRDVLPLPPRKISNVRQTLISRDLEGVHVREEMRRALGRYEWVDRDRKVVRIPIERAMELRARGELP
jgi:hypothetical protein